MRLSRIWRIMQIEEGVLRWGRRPSWITPSKICIVPYILRKPTCSQVFHCDARYAKCFDSCLIKGYVANLVKLHFTPWNINNHSYIVDYLATQIIEKSAMTTPQTCLGYMSKEICSLNDFLPEIVLKFQNNLQHKRQDDN